MGVRVLSFQKKRKNQRKVDYVFLPQSLLNSGVFRGLYTGSCPAFLRCLFRPEPAALAFSLFAAHASYNLYSFRDSANELFLFRQVSPAPCSPPLGGSDENSAVRFTPAVKYGGRENWPSRRETRCMSGHPSRAHHKLKWARKMQSVLGVLYELPPRSESNNEISAQSLVVSQTPTDQPVFDRGWQQPLNHSPRVKQSSCASNGSRTGFANTAALRPQPQRPSKRTKSRK